jgi:hypothetical protein
MWRLVVWQNFTVVRRHNASIFGVQKQVKQTTSKKEAEQAECASETSVNLYKTKHRHIPQEYSSFSSP